MSDFDRAERALARAFENHEDDYEFAPLDPAALAVPGTGSSTEPDAAGPAPRRRRLWLGFAAAAVALVVVAPVAAGVFSMFSGLASAPTSAMPAAAPAEPAASRYESAPEAAAGGAGAPQDSAADPGAQAAQAGWRWETMLDAEVQVPGDWDYGYAPGPDWCVAGRYQRYDRPFVDLNPVDQPPADVQCTGPVDDALRQTHLTWREARPTDVDGVIEASPGWVRVSRAVGSAYLTVEVPAADQSLAEQILATARSVR